MSVVMLVSGGIDSTLMALLGREEGLDIRPLFIDYGQRAVVEEWKACQSVFKRNKLPKPVKMRLGGYGRCIPTGLTSSKLDIIARVFLPGRNLLLLLAGSAYATSVGAHEVAIGLLDESQRMFEDQSRDFLSRAESLLRTATAAPIVVRAPLIGFSKGAVLELAAKRGITGTYSCHAGTKRPCRKCLSCQERLTAERQLHGR